MFLLGVLAAWSAAHVGLALFFALAYLVGRREQEYLLFALLCAAFSVLTGGMAFDYADGPLSHRYLADQITHMAAILAAVVNLHFALSLARPERKVPLIRPLYVLALAFVLADWLGVLWVPGSYRLVESHALGFSVQHALGRVTVVGFVYYATAGLETLATIYVLGRTYKNGQREVLPALAASLAVVVALVNDIALATDLIRNTFTLLPHVFMLYALGAAGTLLFRYRVAAGQLEQTASSLQQRTEELRHSYAELAQVQSELVTKKQLAAVGELAAAIAHEVRNPLAVIVNAVAGLRRAGIREEDRTMLLDIVDEEAGRLNRLVTDLLRFARPVSVKRSPVSLVELANRCRTAVGDSFEIRVELATDSGVQIVDADPNLFRLVFDNLVANACQSMGESGVVEIRIDRAELLGQAAARIEIRDKGHGMEPQVLERALDPFFTTRPSGTGLGLPIVHRIIEAHGGELLIDSLEGKGTRVVIIVPVHAPSEAASEEQRA
jgi:signal transduction histidine kinase